MYSKENLQLNFFNFSHLVEKVGFSIVSHLLPCHAIHLIILRLRGKRKCDIVREYDIASSLLDKWIAQAEHSGSFKEKDNRTLEQQELINLRKQNQQLKMENDILKQAALILGRK